MTREHLHAAFGTGLFVCFAYIPAKVRDGTLVILTTLRAFLAVGLAYREIRPLGLIVAVIPSYAICMDVARLVLYVAGALTIIAVMRTALLCVGAGSARVQLLLQVTSFATCCYLNLILNLRGVAVCFTSQADVNR